MMKKSTLAGLAIAMLMAPLVAQQSAPAENSIALKYGKFDPLESTPTVPEMLTATPASRLWIVQTHGLPTGSTRQALQELGAQIYSYLPHNAYVVRMSSGMAVRVSQQETIRWVGHYQPAYRLEAALLAELAKGDVAARRYNIVVVDRNQDKPALARNIAALGGTVDNELAGSILFEVTLTGAQLAAAAHLDEVLWIDRWTPDEEDMDNARIQGGGNYVETAGGYTGKGVNGHVYEGVESTHSDFTNTPINIFSSGAAQSHGHATAGIVYGNGTSHPNARGMAPDAQPFYTNYSTVSTTRINVFKELVNNRQCNITTASWGGGRTTQYTSTSADSDDAIFQTDMIWTQSQSNAGNQQSRPQAWAKNIMSIGGVAHRDNSNPNDDSWAAGGGSTGPAADGRIKPDLAAYYDSIHTSDLSGSAGYSSGNSYTSFGGTSGATPIVSGHNVLAWQMFTDGIFGPQRVPGGTRWQNRPHFTTHKALMIAHAAQYAFTASSSDNRREHVGWGFPDLRSTWDLRKKTFVVDETCITTQGQTQTYSITVGANEPELKVVMSFADPAGNPAASKAAINDLTLRVTSPSGTSYWGNAGLKQGNYSTTGGSANTVDTVECVFVKSPQAGTWTVEVIATLVAVDNHVETRAVDADFGLVVKGGTGRGNCVQVKPGSIIEYGKSCTGSRTAPSICASVNPNAGALSGTTTGNEYAYPINATTALNIDTLEVYAAAAGASPVTIPIAIHGAGPSATALGSTTITIGTTAGWYSATLASPVAIPAGTFYVAVDNTSSPSVLSNLSSGATVTSYWRRSGASWASSGIVTRPCARVRCVGGGGSNISPELHGSGNPIIGGSFSIDLEKAVGNTAATLVAGVSRSVWIGGGLPFDLSPFGATNCFVLASTEATSAVTVNGAGTTSVGITVPPVVALKGTKAYVQFIVLDGPANALGIVTTNGAEITFGG